MWAIFDPTSETIRAQYGPVKKQAPQKIEMRKKSHFQQNTQSSQKTFPQLPLTISKSPLTYHNIYFFKISKIRSYCSLQAR